MSRPWFTVLTALLAICSFTGAAQAQFSVQKFLPGTHALDYLSVSSAEVNGHLRPHVGFVFDLATKPLVFENSMIGAKQQIIDQIMVFDWIGSLSLFERVELGIDVPLAFISGQQGTSVVTVSEIPSFSLGDLRVNVKANILPHGRMGWGLAVQLGMTVPTGKDASFMSEANVTFVPKIIAEFNFNDFKGALNVGYRVREDSLLGFLDIRDELLLGLAVSIPLYERTLFGLGEIQGATDVEDFFTGRNTRYLEGDLGLKWVSGVGLYASLAVGGGFLVGVGNPGVRVIAGVGWAPAMYGRRGQWRDGNHVARLHRQVASPPESVKLSPVEPRVTDVETLPDLVPPKTGARAPGDAAVVIGIQDYDRLPPARYANQDARLFRDWLVHTRGVPAERVVNLYQSPSIRERIRDEIQATARQVAAARSEHRDATLFVYFAGHGSVVKRGNGVDLLLLGKDAEGTRESVGYRSIRRSELVSWAQGAGVTRLVMVVDACFSGTTRGGQSLSPDGSRITVPAGYGGPELHEEHLDLVFWAAAGPDQTAQPLGSVRHGRFTYFAVGALSGWANGPDAGRSTAVRLSDAQAYTVRALAALEGNSQRAQRPELHGSQGLMDEALVTLDRAAVLRGPDIDALSGGIVKPAPVQRDGGPEGTW
jgi:hypothetical protein